MTENYTFAPVGIIHSPYKEKFAVPRQPGLVTAAKASLELLGECNREEILRGLDGFSHIWVTFVFHQAIRDGWKPTVRPPRLGGNQRVGVFASRSPFRPNPIGLSVIKLEGIELRQKRWHLLLSGIDLVDGTPVLDIKPYVPYADAISNARSGFAPEPPATALAVYFNTEAQTALIQLQTDYADLETLIKQIIAQQPQPAYQTDIPTTADQSRRYGMNVYDLNICWTVTQQGCEVISITRPGAVP